MTCLYCEEPILPDEPHNEIANGSLHVECNVRMLMGSAAHQLRECHCYGGNREDPEGMTRRDAARLAYEVFQIERREKT